MHDQGWIDEKRQKRMAAVDAFDPEMRSLIHEYGYNIVLAFVQIGVKKPNHVKHLVETVLNEFSPTRGSFSKQGIRTEVKKALPQVAALDGN